MFVADGDVLIQVCPTAVDAFVVIVLFVRITTSQIQ